jgi:hypothetical protein
VVACPQGRKSQGQAKDRGQIINESFPDCPMRGVIFFHQVVGPLVLWPTTAIASPRQLVGVAGALRFLGEPGGAFAVFAGGGS